MPPAKRFRAFLIVFTALCLAALILVLLDEFAGYAWVTRIVNIGQKFGRLSFTAVAITFILVEGVPLMLASWLRKEEIKQAREEGRTEGRTEGHAEGRAEGRTEGHAEGRTEGHAEGRAEGRTEGHAEGRAAERELVLEAERQRREGETLEQALARMESERQNRR